MMLTMGETKSVLLESHQREIRKEEDTLMVTWEGREKIPEPAGGLTDGGEVCDMVYKKQFKSPHCRKGTWLVWRRGQ